MTRKATYGYQPQDSTDLETHLFYALQGYSVDSNSSTYKWQNSRWMPISRYLDKYDDHQIRTFYGVYSGNTAGEWEYDLEEINARVYDAMGRITEVTTRYRSQLTHGQFKLVSKIELRYLGSNRLRHEDETYVWDTTALAWKPQSKYHEIAWGPEGFLRYHKYSEYENGVYVLKDIDSATLYTQSTFVCLCVDQ